jgi:hypothetical protein
MFANYPRNDNRHAQDNRAQDNRAQDNHAQDNRYARDNVRYRDPSRNSPTYIDTIGGIPIHISKLRGNSLNSNWALWNSDLMVYFNARELDKKALEYEQAFDNSLFGATVGGKKTRAGDESPRPWLRYRQWQQTVESAERTRKAMMWFLVEEDTRTRYLGDMHGKEIKSEDVHKRLHERLGGKSPCKSFPLITGLFLVGESLTFYLV